MDYTSFFNELWNDYIKITPQAENIHTIFKNKYGSVINDHIAFRTFNLNPISIGELEPHFFEMGYKYDAEYEFQEKMLYAKSYVHPDENAPMIFLSQILTEELSEEARKIIYKLVSQIGNEFTSDPNFFYSGVWWDTPTYEQYQTLAKESEYAAWLGLMGMRANHFTIRVQSIQDALDIVEENGYELNLSGGRIKGSAKDLLEQGSTLADKVEFVFGDGSKHIVPTCYYEFAKRHNQSDGKMYKGFVAGSADKIFESTNKE